MNKDTMNTMNKDKDKILSFLFLDYTHHHLLILKMIFSTTTIVRLDKGCN